jgi:hypothetical protein
MQGTLFDTDDAPPAPVKPSKVPPLREPFAEPPELPRGRCPYRLTIAAELDAIAGEYERGEANEDEVMRHLRGCVFALTPDELLRVGKGIANLLREKP